MSYVVVGSVHLRGVSSSHFCDLSVWNPSNTLLARCPSFPGVTRGPKPTGDHREGFPLPTVRVPVRGIGSGGDDPGEGYYG